MISKKDLSQMVFEAVEKNGGAATIIDVAKYLWANYERDLHSSGNLFFTWQYDMRWAAQSLRDTGMFRPANVSPRGVWEIAV
ncbi:MAG: hypothetical protein ISR44_05360 [Rhodospirillales bacterium]|nr:hypothetical protein [Rhodospirillales bacterium]